MHIPDRFDVLDIKDGFGFNYRAFQSWKAILKRRHMLPGIAIITADKRQDIFRFGLSCWLSEYMSFSELHILDQHTIESPEMMDALRKTLFFIVVYTPTFGYLETLNKQIRKVQPVARIIVIDLNNCFKGHQIKLMIRNGANGYLTSYAGFEDLHQCFTACSMGHVFLCCYAQQLMLNAVVEQEQATLLTDAEKQILEKTVKGYSIRETAAMLRLSTMSIIHHRKNILSKLSAGTIKSASAKAFELGVLK